MRLSVMRWQYSSRTRIRRTIVDNLQNLFLALVCLLRNKDIYALPINACFCMLMEKPWPNYITYDAIEGTTDRCIQGYVFCLSALLQSSHVCAVCTHAFILYSS